MTEQTSKIYPTSTDSVAHMLGLSGQENMVGILENSQAEEVSAHVLPVPDLPIEVRKKTEAENQTDRLPKPKADVDLEMEAIENRSPFKKILKAGLPYFLVFIIGLGAYYFFISNTSLNLSSVFKASTKEKIAPLTVKDTALMALQKDSAIIQNYQKWISQFYFDVSDSIVTDPNSDNSGNGLTNFQKFLLDLNPKVYDTLSTGLADSQTIASGINPLSGRELTEKQKDIVEKYFDLEIINNRLAVESLRRNGLVAGENVALSGQNPYAISSIQLETARNGPKTVQRVSQPTQNASAGGFDNPINPEINSSDLNIDIPGRLEVPALKINVPIIFTKDPKNFEKDLQLGVVHYPGTALPGQIGTTYISGHSSNYAFARGNFNKVFSRLGDLPDNSSFIITVVQKNGKDARFHYVVTHRKEFSPTDQEQFRNVGESVVALSTCWPVGSTKSRLVVFGKLTQIDK